MTFSYQWLRNGSMIASANSNSYVLTDTDSGTEISCQVTAANTHGQTNAYSNKKAIPGAAATGPWTPAEISTDLWLDAADESTIANDINGVSVWRDKSGNSRNATQSTDVRKPATGLNVLNSLNTISFTGTALNNGTSDYFTIVYSKIYSSQSVFCVFRPTNTFTFDRVYTQRTQDAGGVDNGGTNYYLPVLRNNANSTFGSYISAGLVSGYTTANGEPILVASIHSSNSLENFANGVSAGFVAHNFPLNHIDTWIGINPQLNSGFGGDIAEIIVADYVPSQEDRQKIEGYLAHKWGLEGNLPAEHPYKSEAPAITTAMPWPTPVTAKSVVFDIADNHGATDELSIRSIDFFKDGSLIPMTSGFATYATSAYSGFGPEKAFTTSLSRTGSYIGTSWTTINLSNQRLIIVFDTPVEFDSIEINNTHHYGTLTSRGANNLVVTSSTDIITSVIYNEAISNSTVIFAGQLRQHVVRDVVDPQTVFAAYPTFDVVYPAEISAATVKESSVYDAGTWGYMAVDPALPVVGSQTWYSWMTNTNVFPARINVDYGNTFIARKMLLENYHHSGTYTMRGIRSFSIYGSNSVVALSTTSGSNLTDLTLLGEFNALIHIGADAPDPQIFEFANSVAYRYYTLIVHSNYGDAYAGIRHFELYSVMPESYVATPAPAIQRVTTWYCNNSYGAPANLEDRNTTTYVQQFTYCCGDFVTPFQLSEFRIATHNSTSYSAMMGLKLQGSNDTTDGSNGTWADLVTFNTTNFPAPVTYPGWSPMMEVNAATAYKYYRVTGTGSSSTVMNEWELWSA